MLINSTQKEDFVLRSRCKSLDCAVCRASSSGHNAISIIQF